MNLSNATFTAARGCLIQIDGFAADIETKTSLLMQGVCYITALNSADRDKAEVLLISPCGQDGPCLAAQSRAWSSSPPVTAPG